MSASLAERMARALGFAGLNQKQLEDRAGLTRGYMSRPLNGERKRIDAQTINRIAEACGVSFEWLSTGRGEMALAGGATPASSSPAGEGAVREEARNPFERALAEAFRRGDFELADLDAIRTLLRHGASLLRDEADLVEAATSWLRAAATLRRDARPVTIETLAYRMWTLGSERSTRALDARSHALNAEAREELRRLGAEPPAEPVLPPRRPGEQTAGQPGEQPGD